MNGQTDNFTLEYACNSAREQRWFVGRVTRFAGASGGRVVVAHENITERKEAEEALSARNRDLAILNGVAIELASIEASRDLYKYIASKLRTLTGAASATFGVYDPRSQQLHVEYADLEQNLVTGLIQALGGKALSEASFPISDDVRRDMVQYPIRVMDTLSDVTFGVVSPLVGKITQKAQGIDHFVAVAFVVDGALFGASVLGMRAGQPDPSLDMLRAFANLAAVSLRRKQAEVALYESERNLTRAQEIAHLGNWERDLVHDTYTRSAEIYRIYGVSEDYAMTDANKMQMFHPDDRQRAEEISRRMVSEPVEAELRIVRPNGEIRYIHQIAEPVRDATGKVVRVFGINQDITEHKQSEEALRRSEERYRAVSEAADAGISIVDSEENLLYANPALSRMLNYPLDELIGMNLSQLVDSAEFARYRALTEERSAGVSGRYETKIRRKDGKIVDLLVSAAPLRAADGRYESALAVLVDITERKQLEEQLAQSHKLESVGLLAGGVAHDLNNMLVPILGYAEMLRDDMPPTDARRADAQEIVRAGTRARDLVRQLLAFARKQILEMKLLDLNEVISNLYKMLRRTLREDIAIETVLASGLGMVKGDVGQIEQVLMNLCVNAQDAMPQGGTLRIETSAVTMDGSREGLAAGHYIQMAVSDIGMGMDQETLSHIFEPFFTTKGVGKGTGLGLATVYGIIKQHSGHIEVESRVGKGSVFRVYWPQAAQPSAAEASSAPDAEAARGAETILVVEDQDEVRAIALRLLARQGYQVLAAGSGAEALELAAVHPGPIHLLLTDIVMPGMDGRALYAALAAKRPMLQVIYMSGHSEDVIGRHGILEPGIAFVQKPFAMRTLTTRVREVLDHRPERNSPDAIRRT